MIQETVFAKYVVIPALAAVIFFTGISGPERKHDPQVKETKLFSILNFGIKQKAAFEKQKRQTREQRLKKEEAQKKLKNETKTYPTYEEYETDLDKMLDSGYETVRNYFNDNGNIVVEYQKT